MWPALTLLLLVTVILCLHLGWRRKFALLAAELERERQNNTALHQAQTQSAEQVRVRQKMLFDSMNEGVLILDSELRVRLTNRCVNLLFGITDDCAGRTLMEVFRRHELQELARQVMNSGATSEVEIETTGASPRSLQVSAAAQRLKDSAPTGVIMVFHDQTRLRQLEGTRRDFVANVSHELRTPLSMIRAAVETLLDGAHSDPEAAARFLNIIQRHTDRLSFLIEDLLTLSELESATLAFHFDRVGLRNLADRVLEDLAPAASRRETHLANEIPGDIAAQADAARLQQVFHNLADNAIKYGREGGQVQIGARLSAAGEVECWVRDDGPGIPPEAAERVFERFYRVDRARSREQGGTGLGLAIVKHIVQGHGGRVWIESAPDKGATFCFTLRPCA